MLPSRIQAELPVPENRLQLDINALNYCSFSAIQTDYKDAEAGITLAVPHTIDSGYIDLYHLPSKTRTKTAIGKADLATLGVKESRAGKTRLCGYSSTLKNLLMFHLPWQPL